METFGWIMFFPIIVAGIGTFMPWRSKEKNRLNHKVHCSRVYIFPGLLLIKDGNKKG